MAVDFDQLSLTGRIDESQQTMERLWGEVYRLDSWFFLARGEVPDVRPFIGMVQQRPFVMAFTDAARVAEFAQRQGIAAEDGSARALSMPPDGFASMVQAYIDGGVFGILFNDGPAGFFAPLTNVVPMLEFYAEGSATEER